MMSKGLYWVLAVICGGLSIPFFMGKGKAILDKFSSAEERKQERSPENERKYQRVVGFFLAFLAADEVLLATVGDKARWIPLLSIGLVVAALVITVYFMRKYS